MFHPFDDHPDHPRGSRGHYDPNQPRVPPGHPGGGQWTSAGGWALSDLAQLPAPGLRKPEIPRIPPGMYPQYAFAEEQLPPFQAPTRPETPPPTPRTAPVSPRPSAPPPRIAKGGWIALLGLGLWWLHQRLSGEDGDDEHVVVGMRAREFRRDLGSVEFASERMLNLEEVRTYCPDIETIQNLLDRARNAIGNPKNFKGDRGAYGNAVDEKFKELLRDVNADRLSKDKPEIFIIDKTFAWDGKENPKSNERGAKTPDALQERGKDLCVYEVSTGEKEDDRDGMLALVTNISRTKSMNEFLAIILTRVKPSTPPPPSKRVR